MEIIAELQKTSSISSKNLGIKDTLTIISRYFNIAILVVDRKGRHNLVWCRRTEQCH